MRWLEIPEGEISIDCKWLMIGGTIILVDDVRLFQALGEDAIRIVWKDKSFTDIGFQGREERDDELNYIWDSI